MTEYSIRNNDPVEFSSRRKRSLNRMRLMDVDKSTNADQMPPDTPIAIYSRVSSEEQVNACEAWAAQRKWKIAECYSDPGHSGKDDNRPGFQNMIAHAREGRFKAIIFHKLDRFSRNAEQTMRHFRDLNAYDVTLASVTEDFDYTTAQGRFVFRMMALFAQWSLENLSAEVVKSKVEMARQGVQNGPVPFGYLKDQENKQIIIVPDEAQMIQTAFTMYASGNFTDQTVADFLNQSGIKTRKGNLWSKDTVTDFLQNEFYYGKVAYRDQLWPGRHQPIISKELFDQAMEIRAKHARRPRTYIALNKISHPNLLQRIVYCSECERSLRIQSSRRYGYYIETSRYRGKECSASRGRARMDYLDNHTLHLLRNLRLPEDWQQDIERLLEDLDVVRKIEDRRIEIDEEIRRVGRAFADGVFDEESYDRRRKKLLAEKDSLIIPDGAKSIEMGMQLENIGDFLDDATTEEKYKILHMLFDALYYDFSRKKIVRIKLQSEFVHIFRLAASELGWTETDGFIFHVDG